MSHSTIEALHLSNCRVRELIACLQKIEGNPTRVHSQDFDDLRAELISSMVWLRGLTSDSMLIAELAKEISTYRSSLEQLQQMLPAIHLRLLAEKTRLLTEHVHLGAATDWVKASTSTI